jgi:hypothetical protein
MNNRVVLFLILMGIAVSAAAYPITPRPLRKLVLEAEVIVWADVLRIEDVNDSDDWISTKAILLIHENLQSSTNQDTIAVFFSPGMVCPAPAHYEAGTSVLAFLRRSENKGEYVTHALSYGSKTMSEADYQIYKQRIIEMQDIIEHTKGEENVTKTIDWLLRCALNPVTRWEGVYELSPQSDFMSYYDRDLDILVPRVPLTGEQKLLIRHALFSIDTLTYPDLGLVDLIASGKDIEVADFLVKQLGLQSAQTVWLRHELFIRILELSKREGLDELIRKYSELDYEDEEYDEKANSITQAFVNAYQQND